MAEVLTSRDIHVDEWADFVAAHPSGHFFQTPQAFEVWQATDLCHPVALFAIGPNGITGLISSVIVAEYTGLRGSLSARCIVWGGPLVAGGDTATAGLLIEALSRSVRGMAVYTEFRNLFAQNHIERAFSDNSYIYHPHLNIRINLQQSFEKLSLSIHPSRLGNWRKALRKGLEIRELESWRDIEEGYRLVYETYRRVRVPTPHISLFRAHYDLLIPGRDVRFVGAFREGLMIGFRLSLIGGGVMYDYYAGSDLRHSNIYPNDALILHLLEAGCSDDSLKTFDFGGAGKPGIPYGVRDHKLKFGGELVEYGRYRRINRHLVYRLSVAGYSLWRLTGRIFKR